MKMFTINELAEMADVHRATIIRWIKKGVAPAYHLTPTGYYKFSENDVQEWFASMRHEGAGKGRKPECEKRSGEPAS